MEAPIRDSEEDLSRMKPLITMFFCFFLRMMYLPDCIYSTGSFETECANSGITAGRLLLYLSVTDVLLKRIHTKRLHLSAG